MQAYHHYQHDAIFLAGIPDVPASLPHSPVHAEQDVMTGTNAGEFVRVKFSESQRKVIARLWPDLASQLRLDEKKDRVVKLQKSELDRIHQEGKVSLFKAKGRERTSLRKVIEIASQHGSTATTGRHTYQFRVVLASSDPPIWRRIQVEDGTLEALHFHIQDAMGWDNCHLHQFESP